MPIARSTGFDMRNTQNISIIRSEPPPVISDETTWSLSGAAVGFISWLLALGIPFLIYGSNTLFSSSTPGRSSGLNAGCRRGWHCAALADERQASVQRLRDDFDRRADVWSAVPLAAGIVLSAYESSLGIGDKNVVQSPRYAASSARRSRELGRVMG
jgi:hypothetical protein